MRPKHEPSSHFSPRRKRTANWTSASDAGSQRSESKSNLITRFNMKKELALYEAATLTMLAFVGTLLLIHAGLALIEFLAE